ncbi:MAG: ribonuclease Y [Bacteroides sp.]|nr:ribonuclease Y [Bacillota bacterium]MCM1394460.1 ribonuclease Y [[Eubacterium] siraeum]MCM1456188.1 ribonuclease Y [Bacteroides sp.]
MTEFSLLLSAISGGGVAGIAIGVAVVGAAIGAVICYFVYKHYLTGRIHSAKSEAERIINEANAEAQSIRKDGMVDAKEEMNRRRDEFERETRERKQDWQRTENRLAQKESALDKKEDLIDKKSATLDRKIEDAERIQKQNEDTKERLKVIEEELGRSKEIMQKELERVSGMTKEEAATELKSELLEGVKKDAAQEAKAIIAESKENAQKEARNIISQAIQRCAADHATENTVSVVALPNDEMKGRIIGRMGRNIRALESATGVDLIIDDTPDVITLSSFDPVRREVARLTLEKLITDGRIHPARIEEIVDKVRREVEAGIKEAGEEAAFEVGVHGLHPEVVKILGRLKYRTSYGQNVLKHSVEVASLAAVMAAELGIDPKIAKRAGLLHDIGKAVDHELEGTHIQLGVEIAKKYRENGDVIHAIAAHHNDIEPTTIDAVLVQAADAISSARPGARRESLENYVKRIEKLEEIAKSFDGVDQTFAVQAGREIRVMVKPEKVNDANTVFLAKEIAEKLENELEYPGQIKVNVIREVRSVEYAK